MRVYLDAAAVIYVVERIQPYAAFVDQRLSAENVELVVSDLTRLECRIKPMREQDNDLLNDFDTFFERTISEVVELSRNIVDQATVVRAQYGFRTPDALHLAAAMSMGCDVFLTNDRRLNRFAGVVIEVIEP